MLNISYQEIGETLGSLVEFPYSEAALTWRNHFDYVREIKHYGIWFTSENIAVHIFAASFELT